MELVITLGIIGTIVGIGIAIGLYVNRKIAFELMVDKIERIEKALGHRVSSNLWSGTHFDTITTLTDTVNKLENKVRYLEEKLNPETQELIDEYVLLHSCSIKHTAYNEFTVMKSIWPDILSRKEVQESVNKKKAEKYDSCKDKCKEENTIINNNGTITSPWYTFTPRMGVKLPDDYEINKDTLTIEKKKKSKGRKK